MPQPLVSQITRIEPYSLRRLTFSLSAAYQTIVEIFEYYDRMDGLDEMDRLKDVKEWLDEALSELFGEDKVVAWQAEAVTPEFSPFALKW